MGVKLLRNLRGVLTSRKFFSNWWFLPLKFVSGVDKFEVRCRDGGISLLIVLSIGGL
jgi:hypothetical protein